MQIINIFMGHSAVSAKSLHLMSSRSLAAPILTLHQIQTYPFQDEFLALNHLNYTYKHYKCPSNLFKKSYVKVCIF